MVQILVVVTAFLAPKEGNLPLLDAVRTRLEFKILLLMIAVLIAGFGTYVVVTIQQESKVLVDQQRRTLRTSSETLMAGIRNVMLTGKAPFAVEMVNDVRQNLEFVDVTIYDRFGREVFLREGEGVNMHVNDSHVKEVLSTHREQTTVMKDSSDEVYTRYEPLENRPECWRCHDRNEALRGVIQVALKPSMVEMMSSHDALKNMASTMGNAVATAFRTIMLGGNGEQMDTLMASAREMPAIELVQVYNREGFLHFGPDVEELPDTKITPFTRTKTSEHRIEELGKKLRMYIPLENEERCQVCHGTKYPMRGVMVIDFRADTLRKYLRDPEKMFTWALQATIFEGFRSIMLVGRANSVRFYMDELRSQSVLQTLRVFDKEGNERFLNPPPRSRPQLKSVVDKLDTLEFIETVGDEESMVRISPLPNQNRCHACHGAAHKVRAAVEVSTSMKTINAEIRLNKIRSASVGTLTIFLVWMVIRFFMRTVVVKPVQDIEQVASRIGNGDFSARAKVGSKDEIGNLALRMNEMVHGLRERFHLEKFVSRQTVDAVHRADLAGVKLGGERRLATVFFSDIRGFTAYSEKVEPERVIGMLNTCLSKQASIIKKYGGDIDKFVGDEMIALFVGDGMVENAVRAAVEIQREVTNGLAEEDKRAISVGIGINTGEMVLGAMGSADRMDYTVIGDNVNLGARLCSAAKSKQILLSEYSAKYILGNKEFHCAGLEPITVKGKQAPLTVYEVQWNHEQ